MTDDFDESVRYEDPESEYSQDDDLEREDDQDFDKNEEWENSGDNTPDGYDDFGRPE